MKKLREDFSDDFDFDLEEFDDDDDIYEAEDADY